MIIAPFTAGALGWSLSEYVLHRWVGHDTKSKTEFAREHLQHHAQRFYFAPTRTKIRGVTPVLLTALGLATWAFGVTGAAFVAGYTVTYVGYEFLHRRLHTHGPRGRVGRFLRRHHFAHHFNAPQSNHGVTTPVWDVVFRTLRDPGVIRVPEKHAMMWLADPETGDARAEYAADYVIHRPSKKKHAGRDAD